MLVQQFASKRVAQLMRRFSGSLDERDPDASPGGLVEAGLAGQAEAGGEKVLEDVDGVGVEVRVEGEEGIERLVGHRDTTAAHIPRAQTTLRPGVRLGSPASLVQPEIDPGSREGSQAGAGLFSS